MLGFKGLAWRERRAAADPAQAQPDAADRRLSPHSGAAGGRRPVVRHPPDRPRARAARALAHPVSRSGQRRRRGRSPGGPSTSSCGRWRCSSRASMPTTCRPACTRTAPACTACRRPRSRRCARRPIRNLHLVRPQIAVARRHAAGRPAAISWAARPASPISPPITSSGSSRAATSTAGRSSRPTRACWPGATAWPRSAMASAPTSTPARRWPPPAPPNRRRRARRSRRTAIRSPASTPACARRTTPGTGSRARCSFVDAHEIALLRHDPEVGRVAVHFPRLGYDWRRVA